MTTPTLKVIYPIEVRRGIMRWAMQMTSGLVLYGVILFLAAGRLNWMAGWAYLGLNATAQILTTIVLVPRQPGMLVERSKVRQGTKQWDRFLALAVALIGPFAIMVTAGLDARFAWSPQVQNGLWLAGLILAFCCQMFVLWAMSSNPFFSTTVHIQAERSHAVTNSGPYMLVRHPGYLGAFLFGLVAPIALTSWCAYVPALLTNLLIIVRTKLEDSTLQRELPGYAEYSASVRYRLFPGIW